MSVRAIVLGTLCAVVCVIYSPAFSEPAIPQPDNDYCLWLPIATPVNAPKLKNPRNLCTRAYLGSSFQFFTPTVDAATRIAAEAGDAHAMLRVGNVEIAQGNATEGIDLLQKSAAKGDIWAMCELGDIYTRGAFVDKDAPEAIRWYRKAEENGSVLAIAKLGTMYASGAGVAKDDTEATRRFRLAAEKGDASAMLVTGERYARGIGVPKDATEAIRWLSEAYDHGSKAIAASLIGQIYDKGDGVPEDASQAFRWYRLAADAGDSNAMKWLASAYRDGRGVEKDPARQQYWEQQAAQHNVITVQRAIQR